jgi:HEPN domain-containing protein
MLSKKNLEELAQIRIDDALYLFRAKRYSASYYLAGYAVELAFKACISKLMLPNVIPDKSFIEAIYTHRLDSLLSTSGLRPEFDAEIKADRLFASYWPIVNNWNEQSRYQIWDQISTANLLKAIRDSKHGVFQWVKNHW